jgi:hypothetical protein
MSHALICSWLDLPAEVWPPDHYRLLGLPPGENDPHRIEERVHERLDAVRRYQMMHPEQATEAMNRIAQAFVCLSEPASKRVYDAALLGTAPAAEEPKAATRTDGEPLDALNVATADDRDPLVLEYDPASQEAAPPIRRALPLPASETIPVAEVVEIPFAQPAYPVAQGLPSESAGRALTTKRQLYQHIVQARALLALWNQVGKHVANPKRRLTRIAEVNGLLQLLNEIREKLHRFPPLLGEVGQPGYLVIALTQMPSASVLATLAPGQREALSRDWEAAQQVLLSHRDFLRREAQFQRKRPLAQRLTRAVRNLIVEHPGRVLVLIALLALNVALLRTYVAGWVGQLAKPVLERVTSPSNSRSSVK